MKVTFVTPEGEELECWAQEDESMLEVAHANDVEMEGACEGSCGGFEDLSPSSSGSKF